MFGFLEISLLSVAGVLLLLRVLPYGRLYRPFFGGGGVLLLITALFPRTDNPIGQFLFGTTGSGLRLPRELFGIVWWILGAWLCKSLLDLVLTRTFFPDNDEPHARRLFADLASGLIYVLAFVGIVGVVFKEPLSTFLATSGSWQSCSVWRSRTPWAMYFPVSRSTSNVHSERVTGSP